MAHTRCGSICEILTASRCFPLCSQHRRLFGSVVHGRLRLPRGQSVTARAARRRPSTRRAPTSMPLCAPSCRGGPRFDFPTHSSIWPQRRTSQKPKIMPAKGQKRRFDNRSITSGLPRSTDTPGGGRHVAKVPLSGVAALIRRRGRTRTDAQAWA
jgi:hypothetical protein